MEPLELKKTNKRNHFFLQVNFFFSAIKTCLCTQLPGSRFCPLLLKGYLLAKFSYRRPELTDSAIRLIAASRGIIMSANFMSLH
jgi:hypothetical protein